MRDQEEDDIKLLFSHNLSRMLFERDWSTAEFSRRIGKGESTVRQWVDGGAMPTAKLMSLIVKALGVHVSELFLPPGARSNATDQALRLAYTKLKDVEREAREAREAITAMLGGSLPRESGGHGGLDETRPRAATPDEWEARE